MLITFFLKFSTSFGQTLYVSGNSENLGNDSFETAVPLTYYNNDYWYTTIEFEANFNKIINYRYLLRNKDGLLIIEGEKDRFINFYDKNLTFVDRWNHAGDPNNVLYTNPFRNILLRSSSSTKRTNEIKINYTEFRVKAPLLNEDETICISGEGSLLKNWNTQNTLLLTLEESWFVIRLDLSLEKFPIKYKYGIYNLKDKKFTAFESGDNRVLQKTLLSQAEATIIHDGFILHLNYWKGSGVAIPVFSLRSKDSFGTGEFTDIKLLIDWAKLTGLKLIQLLPINDTTANHNAMDSYPYAAISAFALNPLYINLSKVAGSSGKEILKSYNKKQKELNDLAHLDYDQVMKFKLSLLKELYIQQRPLLANDGKYEIFINENKAWLKPYAAFCYLRDKYSTADFTTWKYNSVYDEMSIDKMFLTKQEDQISFHYFVQYHLHIQLTEAVNYAHKNQIILKGDIPIGVFRSGCDSWMNPDLFNMDEQSGAPPDDFAVKGQNWGFPTYNWQKMQVQGFEWWKSRFDQMNHYFDAFRIDHILGFFRIWSIPITAVEGILGRFVPAKPIYKSEIESRYILFDHDRYCRPYINDQILNDIFSIDANYIKEKFLVDGGNKLYHFRKEFDSQQKIEKYYKDKDQENNVTFKKGLFDLISNVILIEDDNDPANQFHFRIEMDKTASYLAMDDYSKVQLKELYTDYFYFRQDDLWRKEAMNKLPFLKAGTDMLICGEDLGMVPTCVPDVMSQLGILTLEIQRMPKDPKVEFFHPKDAPYLSVVTPSTHDMSTIRGWWEEDREKTQRFYHYILGHYGEAPFFCEAWINREVINQHLYSPAMWAIFQLQDLLGMDEEIRREDPAEERINVPADPNHQWKYRMNIFLEELIRQDDFNGKLKNVVIKSGRA